MNMDCTIKVHWSHLSPKWQSLFKNQRYNEEAYWMGLIVQDVMYLKVHFLPHPVTLVVSRTQSPSIWEWVLYSLRENINQQESIPVGCELPTFLIPRRLPSPPVGRPPLDADPTRGAIHVTCDACWDTDPLPVDRQTPVKTLPGPKLRLRALIRSLYLEVCDDGVLHVFLLLLQEVVGHGVQSVGTQLVVS